MVTVVTVFVCCQDEAAQLYTGAAFSDITAEAQKVLTRQVPLNLYAYNPLSHNHDRQPSLPFFAFVEHKPLSAE